MKTFKHLQFEAYIVLNEKGESSFEFEKSNLSGRN